MTKLVFRSGVRSQTNGRASLRKRELEVVIRVMLDYQGAGLKNQLTTRAGLAFELNMGMIWKRWNLLAWKRQIFHSWSPRAVTLSTEIAGEPGMPDHSESGGFMLNSRPTKESWFDSVHWTLPAEVFCGQRSRVHWNKHEPIIEWGSISEIIGHY